MSCRTFRLRHEVGGAAWDEEGRRWRIDTSQGTISADVLVGGMGGLTEPNVPEIPGLGDFQGTGFHSAAWNHDHDLTVRATPCRPPPERRTEARY